MQVTRIWGRHPACFSHNLLPFEGSGPPPNATNAISWEESLMNGWLGFGVAVGALVMSGVVSGTTPR